MIIQQEENTPIGDFYHDNGIRKMFNKLDELVDEFEVDTSELIADCDYLISSLKNLKTKIKSAEASAEKKQSAARINLSLNVE